MSNFYRKRHYFTDQMPQRKNLRLRTHDYSSSGRYFITICTRYHTQWLGDTTNDKQMSVTDAGKVVQAEWEWLPNRFPGLELDEFVVMPNHIHGILAITENLRYSQPAKKPRPTLGDIIGDYKGAATYRIRHTIGVVEFEWQKGFYDEIIRDTAMLRDIRHYITTNPEQWFVDKLHPSGDTGRTNTGL